MCGICGVVSTELHDAPLSAHGLSAMTDAIVHRGPDSGGHYRAAGVALGMRRLSILDVDGGSQPLANEDESIWTVFNGEIYNYRDLQSQLRGAHKLRSRGDTETLVHLYEDHGTAFPQKLRGIFGIAVWDAAARKLLLTRDRLGVKPLYYVETANGLAFSSEIKSLIAGGLVKPELDPVAAELFLSLGYVPGPRTLFSSVSKLPPASTLVWQDGQIVDFETYWTSRDNPPPLGVTWAEQQEQLLSLLRFSVRSQMVSEVPVGVMLSGGLDSSLIAALMAEVSPGAVKTFSIGFSESRSANELDDAARVAARIGAEHHPLLTSASNHPELLDDMMWHLEEPVADLSALGFGLLSQLASQHVTVALSGQAADELLGGYRKHLFARLADSVRNLGGSARRTSIGSSTVEVGDSQLRRAVVALTTNNPVARQLATSQIWGINGRERLLGSSYLVPASQSVLSSVISANLDPRANSILSEVLDLDTKLALVDLMFMYFDKMSMASSLEVRVPFTDHDLVAFCTALPDSRKVWKGRQKELLRRASVGLVDDDIIAKKKRAFFVGASGAWITANRANIIHETLLDERSLGRGLFQPAELQRVVSELRRPRRRTAQQLIALLMLEKWCRIFLDSDGPASRLAANAESPGK